MIESVILEFSKSLSYLYISSSVIIINNLSISIKMRILTFDARLVVRVV